MTTSFAARYEMEREEDEVPDLRELILSLPASVGARIGVIVVATMGFQPLPQQGG